MITRGAGLSIESASDAAGVALSADGVVTLAQTWRTERNHSAELLPAIERLLDEAGRTKDDLTAVFVDVGPGAYGGLRAGVSIAKALAHALGLPLAGLGRLELDAFAAREGAPAGARIVAVHRAGRGEVAWAAYRADAAGWREEAAPRIDKVDAIAGALRADDRVTGDIDDELAGAIRAMGAAQAPPAMHRVVALAALGHAHLAAGRGHDPATLVPLYLRGPAIGPRA